MQRMALILAFILVGLSSALAQNVTVIGPITPGDCTMFSSTTIVKDGGLPCPGSGGTLNLPNGTTATTQSPFSDNTTKVATDAFVQGAISLQTTHFAAAGTATCVGNALTISSTSPTNFTLTGNPTISFIAGCSVTGASTLSVTGTGVINLQKKTPGGLVATITGDIISGQQYFATYDGTQYELQTPSQVTNGALVPGAANTVKGSLNGTTTSDLAIASCSALYNFTQWVTGTGWQCGINPVLPSRATAAGLNLSAFSAVTTQGYTTPGDGGGATFKNVSSASFIDSFITTFTITGGSGYTNGSYFGVTLVNTTKPFAIGTATVAGGTVTAVNVAGTPGGLCHVGDVYTTSSIPAGTGFSITVTGCSTPLGSFTDSASTHWQIVYDNASPGVRQFGCKGDWAGTDGTATDNFNCLQAAGWFVSFMDQFNSGNGGFWGGRLLVPQGTFLACGAGTASLIVPNGVILEGASSQGSVIKMCDTFGASVNFVELCDPSWHFACFDSGLRNIQLFATRTAGSSAGFAMVHSNSTQDFGGLDHVYIYGGLRTCAFFEKGYGGASTVQIHHVSCTTASASAQIQIGSVSNNYGTTIIRMEDIILGGPSSGVTFQTTSGLVILGGFVSVDGIHCESMPVCVEVNNAGSISIGQIQLHNVNAGSGAPAPACTGVIQLDGTNAQGNTGISMVPAGSCTNTVTDGQSGGTNRTTAIGPVAPVTFSP